MALRQSLIELSNSRFVQQGQETKMEQVYQYLTAVKFRQRVEAAIKKFKDMREDLDRERRFMGKQWSEGRSPGVSPPGRDNLFRLHPCSEPYLHPSTIH